MTAHSPAPQPSLFQRINRWSGWSGLAVSAAILLAAGGVLVLTSKISPAATPAQPAAATVLPLPYSVADLKEPFVRDGRSTARAELPAGELDSVVAGEIDGRRILEIRAVPNGPTIVLDAQTGEVIDRREYHPLPMPRTTVAVPVF